MGYGKQPLSIKGEKKKTPACNNKYVKSATCDVVYAKGTFLQEMRTEDI
jgi:hypothetical protein